jgi:hypothetical protein
MKCQVPVITLILVGFPYQIAHAKETPFKCFSTPEAVHKAHPGSHAVYTTHATWWSESSKCWFAGIPAEKPKMTPHTDITAASAPSRRLTQAPPLPLKQAVHVPYRETAMAQASYEESVASQQPTYEESAAALRALMFDPDESMTDFEGRFSGIRNAPTFYFWRRCFASPVWDLCQSSM